MKEVLKQVKNDRMKSEALLAWLKRKDELGLKNKDIAQRSGIPLSTVEQIMCGKVKSPRLDTVQAIEKALGLDSPFTPEERAAGISFTARVTVTPDEDDLLTLYREIGEKKGSEAQQLAQRLLEQILKA